MAAIKKISSSDIKYYNQLYFKRGTDKMFGVTKRKFLISPKMRSNIMIEKHEGKGYTVRKIKTAKDIGSPTRYSSIIEVRKVTGLPKLTM